MGFASRDPGSILLVGSALPARRCFDSFSPAAGVRVDCHFLTHFLYTFSKQKKSAKIALCENIFELYQPSLVDPASPPGSFVRFR